MNIIPIPALKDNYIWLLSNEKTKHAWIVDPGDAKPVLTTLNQYSLKLKGIFITHHHHDHSGGVPGLLRHYPNIPVYASQQSTLNFITHRLTENDPISCDEITFKALSIPGHTLDHTAFYNENIVFSGDTLFSFGCGKVFEGIPKQMYHSLMKLKNLNSSTKIYCGHEYTLANLQFAKAVTPENMAILDKITEISALRKKNIPTLPSLLSEEIRLNPFLRCDDKEIIHAVQNQYQKTLTDPIEIFSHLREWKNSFKC